jgi:hypothetical protein
MNKDYNITNNNKTYETTYQNIYNYRNVSSYLIILFIFLFMIYIITVYNKYN